MSKLNMIFDGKGGGYIEGGDPATWFPHLWQMIADLGVRTLLDVGCSEGHAMRWFQDHGLLVEGCDYSKIALAKAPENAHQVDLEKEPYYSSIDPDVVWCCEVVEHIEEKAMWNLMQTLTAGRFLFMTHAIKGQGGHHHVNCQSSGYWIHQLRQAGMVFDRELNERALDASKLDRAEGRVDFWKRSGLVFQQDDNYPKDLILTVANGYKWEELKPFVRSLNRSGFYGDVVMFTGDTDQETSEKLQRHGVWVVPCQKGPPYDCGAGYCRPEDNGLGQLREVYYRFILYKRFLEKHGSKYNRVMACDSRDVWFVGHPFRGLPFALPREHLHIYQEAPPITIGDCPYNSKWVKNAFGNAMLREMLDAPIYCAGVVAGGTVGVHRLCDKLVSFIRQVRPPYSLRGIDQAYLNKIIFKKEIDAVIHPFGQGHVLHVGYMDKNEPPDIPGAVTVLHQYDRNRVLRKEFDDICNQW